MTETRAKFIKKKVLAMNNMEKMERVGCRKLLKSGKTQIKFRGTIFQVIDGSPGVYKIQALHPWLEPGITRIITCHLKA